MYEQLLFCREPCNEWNPHILVWRCADLPNSDYDITDLGSGVIGYKIIKYGTGLPFGAKSRANYARVLNRLENMIYCQKIMKKEALEAMNPVCTSINSGGE